MKLAALGLAFAGSQVASWELPGVGTNRGTLRNYFLLLQKSFPTLQLDCFIYALDL